MQNEIKLEDGLIGFLENQEAISFITEDKVIRDYVRDPYIIPGTEF